LAPSNRGTQRVAAGAVAAFEPGERAARQPAGHRAGDRLDDAVVRALGGGQAAGDGSGWLSYSPLSRRSSALTVGSTNAGPKRRASQPSDRLRQPGRSARAAAPIRVSCLRQYSAWASSTAANRR